jgi:hypothetical protein
MHLVIPGMLVIQLEEGPELKVPSCHSPIDKTMDQVVRSETISSAAPEKSGDPPDRKAGGVAFCD